MRCSFLDDADCFADAAGPRLSVTGKHDVRVEVFDLLERFARASEVAPERRELRPGLPREHVQRCERVADEEHFPCGQMQRGAAFAVAGKVNDARSTRYVESGTVAEGRDLEDR